MPDSLRHSPTLPRILALSRQQLKQFKCSEPYVVISIQSPDEVPLRLRSDPLRKRRINLTFIDGATEWGHIEARDALITDAQARRIAHVFQSYAERCLVVISCHAGKSRSAGVAAGIRAGLGLEPAEFALPPYDPNPQARRFVEAAIRAAVATRRSNPTSQTQMECPEGSRASRHRRSTRPA